jgi:hypothetical protein
VSSVRILLRRYSDDAVLLVTAQDVVRRGRREVLQIRWSNPEAAPHRAYDGQLRLSARQGRTREAPDRRNSRQHVKPAKGVCTIAAS